MNKTRYYVGLGQSTTPRYWTRIWNCTSLKTAKSRFRDCPATQDLNDPETIVIGECHEYSYGLPIQAVAIYNKRSQKWQRVNK